MRFWFKIYPILPQYKKTSVIKDSIWIDTIWNQSSKTPHSLRTKYLGKKMSRLFNHNGIWYFREFNLWNNFLRIQPKWTQTLEMFESNSTLKSNQNQNENQHNEKNERSTNKRNIIRIWGFQWKWCNLN